jgi:type IV pilus modification protein PilV
MLMSYSLGRSQRGFAILEALVAMLIMTIGVLSLSAMQTTINRYSNEAKLRSDATRLAQEKIEALRSFTGIASTIVGQGATSATALNWNALAGNTDTVASANATFTRVWTLSGTTADPMRGIQVTMTWQNRAGESQSLTLSSVIAQADPADSGYLGFPLPLNTNLKRPKDRNLDIPVRSVDLGTGQSGLRYGTGGQYLVFSNVSGDVVKICSPPSLTASSTDAQIIAALTSANSATASCTSISGYIVAGYIKKGSSVSSTEWNAIKDNLGISTSLITRYNNGADAISCNAQDATDQNTGALIPDFKSYICVIPLTAPGANVAATWGGPILISGPSTWRGVSSKYYVCRFQYTATTTFTDPNLRNVQGSSPSLTGYSGVNKSIDQQNYLLAATANSTDTTTPSCLTIAEMNVSGVSSGILHQDCRAASNAANYTAACPVTGAAATYTLAYNGNQNTGGTAPTDPSSPYVAGSPVTVLANSGTLTRDNFTFGGWSIYADGSGAVYAAGNTFTIANNTTLYAVWLADGRVTYSGNNNTGGTAPVDSSTYAAGQTVTVRENTGLLERSGYTFAGWNTLADGTGQDYAGGNTFVISGDKTLYAKWNSVAAVTVTYSGNGNTGGTAPTDGTSYASGSTVTVQGAGSLTKTNAIFNGWNTAMNGSGTSRAAGSTFTISQNTTLYAQWLASITLATPVPTWQNGAPYALTWSAVTGATGYSVASCTTINTASLTPCTPANPVSQTATSKTPTLTNRDTVCYTVTATGPSPYVNSAASAVKCIYFENAGGGSVSTN